MLGKNMKYDFNEIIDRKNTNSFNTDGFRKYIFHADADMEFDCKDDEFIRMWVADMEFAVAPEIRKAMIDRIDRKIFGYTEISDPEYFKAFTDWCLKRYNWSVDKDEISFSPGIVPALFQLVEDILAKNEKFIILTPSYGSFKSAAIYNGIECVYCELINNNGYYSIDFEHLETLAQMDDVHMLIFCNPHNPTGRVWSRAELQKVASIAEANDLWIISDEIHCDITRKGISHTPMGVIMPDYKKLITCMSASKTFNLAGLMMSEIIIRDPAERSIFRSRDKLFGMVNPISVEAHKAAYTKCDEWLSQLRDYLDSNFRFTEQYIKENLPNAVFKIPEATYLAWIDLREYFNNDEDIALFMAERAGVLLESGNTQFVDNAKGFIRLNLAMPRSMLEEGLRRISESIVSKKQ